MMKKRFSTLLLLVVLSSTAYGATLKATLEGKTLVWDNALSHAGAKMPSQWDIPSTLVPTNRWSPGGFSGLPPTEILLSNASGESVTVPVEFLGFDYHSGGASANEGSAFSGPTCSQYDSLGDIYRVEGSNCYYPNNLNLTETVNPFAFIRPVFKVVENDVIALFDGKSLGEFRGGVVLNHTYDYDFNGVSSRYYGRQTFTLAIEHVPATLLSVTLSGTEAMATTYTGQMVSGTTTFNMSALGYFTQGLALSLKESDDYTLRGDDNTGEIPYSVDCSGCVALNLVNEGVVSINDNATTITGTGNSIAFDITVSFADVAFLDLDEGTYRDTFVLVFEPIM
ncbi:hypothetical protein [Shewanella atlantica]|uniref:Uncharacterized protein n=1 Tax=Shewanella atlantica TaxID=271099 RepID=A0A3S0I8K8_9GAMM|nr:hypothetical protein [Shewanella atlantica]RTR27707.1 hypothetical protein EKG39_20110 [Shewanella atlantica]